jgi:poly(3-hydroxybutyrate) depolymerase
MNASRIGTLSLALLAILAACSVVDEGDELSPTAGTGTGGSGTAGSTATTSGGSTGNSGAPTTSGGSAMAGSSSGGTGSPTAGSSTMAGSSSGGASGGTASAGSSSGGTASGGSGGGGNGMVKPSAGCSKASAQVTIPNSLVGVPTGYDGKTPVPVVIAFHAAGNDNTSIQNAFKNSDLAKKYLMVYPNSTSATTANKTGWNMQADKNRYLEVQAAISAQACVDENRIYATGHSSGAQFVVALLCSGDGAFDAVAPVASSVACQKWKNGAVPALIIHGVQDEERTKYNLNDGDGKKDLQPYLTSNMCMQTTTPFTPDVSKCNNIQGVDGKAFNPGCVEFAGCSVKTRWCNHNDPNYGTTNHGIPCFGVRAIYDFFESL